MRYQNNGANEFGLGYSWEDGAYPDPPDPIRKKWMVKIKRKSHQSDQKKNITRKILVKVVLIPTHNEEL
jgi:hypothetical protein